jgi:hypothetical protein
MPSLIECKPIIAKMPTGDIEAFIALAKRELEASARKMLDALATYPAYKHVSWKSLGGFKTDKQRRFVMANIRKGIIKIPRPRTGTLGRSWSIKEASTDDRIAFIIGSNGNIAPYNRHVQDEPNQSRRHQRIGWKTIQDVSRTMWPIESKRIQNALNRFQPGAK